MIWDPEDIQTQRLWLTRLSADDLPVVHDDFGRPETARMSATVKPGWSLDEARDWLEMRVPRSEMGTGFAIRLSADGPMIGMVGMGGQPRELGYMIATNYWGKGYASEAVQAFVNAAFSQCEGLDDIEAGVFDDNPASVRVLEKAGFRRVGTAGCQSAGRVEDAPSSAYRLTRTEFEATR